MYQAPKSRKSGLADSPVTVIATIDPPNTARRPFGKACSRNSHLRDVEIRAGRCGDLMVRHGQAPRDHVETPETYGAEHM